MCPPSTQVFHVYSFICHRRYKSQCPRRMISRLFKMKNFDLSKHREPFTSWRCFMSRKNWLLNAHCHLNVRVEVRGISQLALRIKCAVNLEGPLVGNLKKQINPCGNRIPTRCNRGFYCRSYCLRNMFRAPLCPSSGAQEYYTVVAACGISCCGFQVAGLVWSWAPDDGHSGARNMLSKQQDLQ